MTSVRWEEPLVFLPLAFVALLALARLARVRPAFRPLVGPFATAVLVGSVFSLAEGHPLPRSPWVALLVLGPLLMLTVRAVSIAFQWIFRRGQGGAPPALLDSGVAVFFYALGIGAIAHHVFGVALTPFLATSAVLGAVVGLALQDTLGNLFAGIALHTESPFRVGDWVKVGDRDGRVEQMSWRALQLRTWDGDTLVVPNNEVARHALLNYSLPAGPHSRVVVLGVSYQTPPDRVLQVLRGALEQVEGLPAAPPPNLRVVAYDESSIRYEIRYFYASYEDYRRVEGEILRLAWYHLRRAGIEIPYPVRNVFMHQVEPAPREDPAERLGRALRRLELFQALSEEEMRTVAGRFRPLRYAGGEKVIEEGQPGDSFFLVDKGELAVLKWLGGRAREVARLRAGECFGEMALLTGERRAATVVAVTDVELFVIDKGGFHDVVSANPALAEEISTLLAERRQALTSAEGDITDRFPTTPPADLKDHILGRIRSYFGL